MSWRVETDNTGLVHIYHHVDQVTLYHENMDAGEAYDLGEDLMIAADTVWAREEAHEVITAFNPFDGFLVYPYGGVVVLDCDTCKIWEQHFRAVDGNLLSAITEAALEHWRDKHSQMAEDAEGEDGDGQAVPPVDEPVAHADTVARAEHGGDDVQDHGQHRRSPFIGGVIAW